MVVVLALITGLIAFNNFISNQKKEADKPMTPEQINPSTQSSSTYKVVPISHASFILNLGGQVIYNDPVGNEATFSGQQRPDIILLSDIHSDHLNAETLKAVSRPETIIVAPPTVLDSLPKNIPGIMVVMKNGEKGTQKGIEIEAIPMYNIPEKSDARHTKGRGNGYVLSAEGKRIYIAGDTGATVEMKLLRNIDVAFVPMNMPFTMSVEDAADGVLAFRPKVVHPYHYRGQNGLSDINKFKQLVEEGDKDIKVELLNFYPY